MRLAKQLFPDKYLLDIDISQQSTGLLIKTGPFYHSVKPGIPLFLPIGHKILSAIESYCLQEARDLTFDSVDMTHVIPTTVLSLGEDFHAGFLDQFVRLSDRMKQFHLLSTPEPFLIHLFKDGLQTYRQLPLQLIFTAKFYRQLNQVKGILKTREFKMLAGMWICEKKTPLHEGMFIFGALTERIAGQFLLPLHSNYDEGDLFQEYFYLHADGEEQFNGKPAISIAMSYVYGKDKILKTTYRTKENKNARARLVTYGLGLQRLWFALLDHYRDQLGFNLPQVIRPFDIVIITSSDQCIPAALSLAKRLNMNREKILIDDRHQVKVSEKATLADYLGIPVKVIVKKGTFIIEYRGNEQKIHAYNLEQLLSVLNL